MSARKRRVARKINQLLRMDDTRSPVPEPTPLDVRPDTVMAKPMPINALWDAIGVYCEAVIDDELAACGIGEKVDPRMRIGAAKRLIGLIGGRTDHDEPAYPANRLHKDAHRTPAVAQPVADEHQIIAAFLERTGQYVTNDASRKAAIAEALEDIAKHVDAIAEDERHTHCTPGLVGEFVELAAEIRSRAALCQPAEEKTTDCSGNPQCCPQNEGYGCNCSALAAKDKP